MHSDPIGDYLTRIRNALNAQHNIVNIPSSKVKYSITNILFQLGYIKNFKLDTSNNKIIKIFLKYFNDNNLKISAIKKIERISKCSIRKYTKVKDIPRVLGGMGSVILSTNKGIMSGFKAKKLNVGGEIICIVY
ncbi:MAG: 30S ribosomal protein S8 [Bacteroides sp.]|nr:MAG: 30S ribosomal protein S8 [Bacteroides sp.]